MSLIYAQSQSSELPTHKAILNTTHIDGLMQRATAALNKTQKPTNIPTY